MPEPTLKDRAEEIVRRAHPIGMAEMTSGDFRNCQEWHDVLAALRSVRREALREAAAVCRECGGSLGTRAAESEDDSVRNALLGEVRATEYLARRLEWLAEHEGETSADA